MKRRKFLKAIGIGSVVVTVSPKLILESGPRPWHEPFLNTPHIINTSFPVNKSDLYNINYIGGTKGIYYQILYKSDIMGIPTKKEFKNLLIS